MWPFSRVPHIDPTHGDPRARALIHALTTRDRETVRGVFGSLPDPDGRAYLMEFASDVPGVQDWIGQWVADEPGSTLPLLIQGCRGVAWAWEARGSAYAEDTSKEQFAGFFERLAFAEKCLKEVVERDPADTTAWTWLTLSARGSQVGRDEAAARFNAVVKYAPEHLIAHEQRLQYLCDKWFGSHAEMFAFAREALARSTPGGLLPTLMADAHLEYWLRLPSGEDQEHIRGAAARQDLVVAAQHSVLNAGFRPVFGWPARANGLAMMLYLAGEYGWAASVFDRIGDHVTKYPWHYISSGDPARRFVDARKDAYAFGR
ncbi:DUF4034 domain-containing protein [Actinoplanes philippinensis]|uniref:DUF4034 domain-containing protein n=1 Tax=Actinoplanes philippinensis TaxID=35752 RepID=UPI0033F2C574